MAYRHIELEQIDLEPDISYEESYVSILGHSK